MELDQFNIDVRDGILIVKKENVSILLSEAKEIRELMQRSTNKKYLYMIFANSLGYYSGYDFGSENYVYCNSLSIPNNISKMKEYIKNKEDEV